MREVKAFVRSTKINEVIKVLRHNGFKSMTVTEVDGTGRFTNPVTALRSSFRSPIAKWLSWTLV